MDALTKEELSTLYSIAVREVQLPEEAVSQDKYARERFYAYWEKLADKLRALHEEAIGEEE